MKYAIRLSKPVFNYKQFFKLKIYNFCSNTLSITQPEANSNNIKKIIWNFKTTQNNKKKSLILKKDKYINTNNHQPDKDKLVPFKENFISFSYKNNISYNKENKNRADEFFFKSNIKLVHHLDDRNINDFKKAMVENNYELYDVYRGLPEILILGRSNVGKSSLINSLFCKEITKPNKTPGKTQKLEFYLFGLNDNNKKNNNKSIYTKLKHEVKINPRGILIDAPGFGWIDGPVVLKKKFKYLIYSYLNYAVRLDQIVYLLNGEYGMNSIDMEHLKFLNKFSKDIQLVFTKVDKLNDNNLIKYVTEASNFTRDLNNVRTEILLTSSKTKYGLSNLRSHLLLDVNQIHELNKADEK